MRILLTNDDGILAPGIEALYHAVRDFGEVAVVAPETSHSGVGHGLTVQSPIAAQRVQVRNDFAGWAVAGRPADCVKLALLELLDWRPDFVISGINVGINTGIYVLYSGTVAGAAEGTVFFNIPSLAISLQLSDHLNFERAGQVARRICEQYTAAQPPAGTCLNVNIPALDSGWPKGVRVCPHRAPSPPAPGTASRSTPAAVRSIGSRAAYRSRPITPKPTPKRFCKATSPSRRSAST